MNKDEIKRRINELTSEERKVTQNKSTEAAFSGKFNDFHEKGMFTCTVCGAELFDADNKFDSGSGWPSFDKASKGNNIEENEDKSMFKKRTEVVCKECGAHLGHVFDDDPKETTGKRYCINSVSLNFKKNEN